MKLARLNNEPEIFHTLQGEGRSIGKPSIFIRLSLCNLHCTWCDTDYTWNWKGTPFKHNYDSDPGYSKYDKHQWISEIAVKELYKAVGQYNCRNIVITGGEPLIQQNELATFCDLLKNEENDFRIEIETNGTIIPNASLDPLIDQYNVSPKLKNSGNPDHLRLKPEALKFFSKHPRSYFKYVIDGPSDLDEVLQLATHYDIKKEKTYLMPQGIDKKELQEKRSWLVEICKAHGFNYTDRLHIHIWGSKRGV